MTPLVSIITPTRNREVFLPHALRCVVAQDWPAVEWLVADDSPSPSRFMQGLREPNVVYLHDPSRASIGAKRNALIARARGEIVVQFDDDDYYAPSYVSHFVRVLQHAQADFAKLTGWFVYSPFYDRLGYCDLEETGGPHYAWSNGPMRFHPGDLSGQRRGFSDNYLSFGFSYVFRRSMWERVPFPEIDWNEDGVFAKAAMRQFRMVFVQDPTGLCMHVMHRSNTSRCFPQYLIPNPLFERIFPGAVAYRSWLLGLAVA